MKVYLIGSLRNPEVPTLANKLREVFPDWEIFDDWYAPGEDADDYWRDYEKNKGHSYKEALQGYAAQHIFEFDLHHIDEADIGILLMPAGKSGHMELGYMIGQGKPCFYVMEPGIERWDVMLQFCYKNGGDVCDRQEELIEKLKNGYFPAPL